MAEEQKKAEPQKEATEAAKRAEWWAKFWKKIGDFVASFGT